MRTTPRSALAIVLSLLLLAPSALLAADEKKSDKQDVSKIGERDVGKGINLYSLESEIALGKQLSQDRKSTRLNSSHIQKSRMPSSA